MKTFATIAVLLASSLTAAANQFDHDCPDLIGQWQCELACEPQAIEAGIQEKTSGCKDLTGNGQDSLGEGMILDYEVKDGVAYGLEIISQKKTTDDKLEIEYGSHGANRNLIVGKSPQDIYQEAAANRGLVEIASCGGKKLSIVESQMDYPASYSKGESFYNPLRLYMRNTVISRISSNTITIEREYIRPDVDGYYGSKLASKAAKTTLNCSKVK